VKHWAAKVAESRRLRGRPATSRRKLDTKEGASLLSEEESFHIAHAKWTVMCNGKLLPVTNLMSLHGDRVGNPMHAHACVAFDPDMGWIAVECKPGDIYPNRSRTDGEIKRFVTDHRECFH